MQVLEDPHFGEVEVYRSKEGLFLMKMIKNAISGDKRHSDFVELMSRVTAGIIPNIVPIVRLHTLACTHKATKKTEYASNIRGYKSLLNTTIIPSVIFVPQKESWISHNYGFCFAVYLTLPYLLNIFPIQPIYIRRMSSWLRLELLASITIIWDLARIAWNIRNLQLGNV